MALGPQLTPAQTEKSSALKISGVVQAGIIKLWNRPSCYFSSNCALCCLVSRHFSINCCVCADNTRSQELLLSFQWPPSSIVLASWPGAAGPCFQHPQPQSRAEVFPCPLHQDSHLLQREYTATHISWRSDLQYLHGDGALWFDILTTKKYLNIPLLHKVDPSWQFHTEISELKFLSPMSLSHPLQGLHRLDIPEWICSSQSAPAVPCILPAPANRGDNKGEPRPHPFTHSVALFFKNTAQCRLLHYRMLL